MMRSTAAAAALALLVMASTAAAQQPCWADSPLRDCPLDLNAPVFSTDTCLCTPATCSDAKAWCGATGADDHFTCTSGSTVAEFGCATETQNCTGTVAPPEQPGNPQFDGNDECPTMLHCAGAQLWCRQTLNQTATDADTDYNMDFACEQPAALKTGVIYSCATEAQNCTGKVNACAQHAVKLRSAASFAVLAGAGVTSSSETGAPTTITGDIGTYPTASVTGFADDVAASVVNGAIHRADATAGIAIGDLTTAYNDAAGRPVNCATSKVGNIGDQTIYAGLYKSTSGMEITGADLTLDAEGDKDAVFIFQMAETFSMTKGMHITLAGKAQAKNVFWQIGTSGNLEKDTVLKGTMMADQSITSQTSAAVDGRVLARIASVTMESATFTLPAE
ncbi:hypothetical protein FOA52_002304 [Chlamydomonas sp. UWO 241]|nr:hypothetical protein FOA52_015295 [Chlamydomonas sp. UWO 241]KAG1673736.1 hypothetical protein FOA52_002304 [Chlamydomonas sp. UWO 241]